MSAGHMSPTIGIMPAIDRPSTCHWVYVTGPYSPSSIPQPNTLA